MPDIAYVSNQRLHPLSDEDVEMPSLAPDAVTVDITGAIAHDVLPDFHYSVRESFDVPRCD